MSEVQKKQCHVCGANNPPHARFCNNCGAALADIPSDEPAPPPKPKTFDPRFGEADLLETQLNWQGGAFVMSGVLLLVLFACAGTVFFVLNQGQFSAFSPAVGSPSPVDEGAVQPVDAPFVTNTPRPTVQLVTVTPAPPTVTITPTPGPCQIEVQPGSTMYEILALCGHRDFDLMQQVLEDNGLPDAGSLQIGQIIEVPRPSPTVDPNATQEVSEDGAEGEASSGGFASVLFADGAEGLPSLTPSPVPTLPPGVQWYTVQADENIIVVASKFGGGVEVLSQLNPEIEFAQCDFGKFTGGPDCTVFLREGQRMRVPAPTPVPTLSPTPSGSETPTPTATATFNAPNLTSPGDRALFRHTELVTLRWAGTGTLAEDEVYRLRVENMNNGLVFMQDVRESFFILPVEWQERDGKRHDYEWRVSVIDLDTPEDPIFVTNSRIFTWEATAEDATPESE